MADRFGDERCSNEGEVEVPDLYGALRGLRSFDLDPETGHLTGVFFKARWTQDVMEAQCLQTKTAQQKHSMYPLSPLAMLMGNGYSHGYAYEDGKPVLKEGHLPAPCPGLARGNHGCGFYAVHGDRRPPENYVIGVVEMYGQVELGSTGLRSSQAKLVAMVDPNGWGTRTRDRDVNQRTVAKLTEAIEEFNAEEPDPDSEEHEEWQHRIDWRWHSVGLAEQRAAKAQKDLDLFAATKFLYPDVAVYATLADMLEAFPVPPIDPEVFK